MANSPQARKRARQNTKRRLQNHAQASSMRTHIKKFIKAINANDSEAAKSAYQDASSHIDKAAKKNIHTKNRAARLKSRLNSRLKAITA